MTKELRFMIKGMPEDILERCDKNLFPENLENIISFYRRSGLVIVVYATKKINLDEYKDLNDLDYYHPILYNPLYQRYSYIHINFNYG